jgi:hypothetical protein
MKKLVIFVIIIYRSIISQETTVIPYLMEILPQTQNFGSVYITYTIEPQNTVAYCKNISQWYSDSPSSNSLVIFGNYIQPPQNQKGFGFDVCYSYDQYPKFWLTVNRITISYEDNSFYFYIDYRDCGYGNENDITIRADKNWGYFISEGLNLNIPTGGQSPTTCGFSSITLGQIFRIGSLLNYSNFKTDCMNNYWSNCLVLVNSNNNPALIWGSHPTFTPISGYKIYRKVVGYNENPDVPATWPLLSTVNSNTFSYKDNDFL